MLGGTLIQVSFTSATPLTSYWILIDGRREVCYCPLSTGGWVANIIFSLDGPALRANAMITYANYLIAHKNISHVITTLWPIIKLDLDYVADNWNKTTSVNGHFGPWASLTAYTAMTSFDLWEEVSSSSFFTTAVQHRSLRQGALLASAISQPSVVAGYTMQATSLLCFLQVCRLYHLVGYSANDSLAVVLEPIIQLNDRQHKQWPLWEGCEYYFDQHPHL